MLRKERFEFVQSYFSQHFPEPETELAFRTPFELLVAVILSAQCTDKRVNLVTPPLFEAYPTPEAMSRATVEDIFAYVRSVSYPNNKAKHLLGTAQLLVHHHHGQVPGTMQELQTLPGVGRKTANVVMGVVFNAPAMAVDTHVFRVSRRIGLAPLTARTPHAVEAHLVKGFAQNTLTRAHHWLILHGRYTCLARTPQCHRCPLTAACRYYAQLQAKGVVRMDNPLSKKRKSTPPKVQLPQSG